MGASLNQPAPCEQTDYRPTALGTHDCGVQGMQLVPSETIVPVNNSTAINSLNMVFTGNSPFPQNHNSAGKKTRLIAWLSQGKPKSACPNETA
jgi:hypothetical protein